MRRGLLLVLACLTADVSAQGDPALSQRVTLSLGNYQFQQGGDGLAPSVELASDLLHFEGALVKLGAALSYSYWSYGEEPEPGCHHCSASDYSAHGLGGRLYAELYAAPLPIRLSLGLLRHVGAIHYDAEPDANAGPITDRSVPVRTTIAEVGVGLSWQLYPRLEAVTDVKVYPRLDGLPNPGPSLGLTIGLGARL